MKVTSWTRQVSWIQIKDNDLVCYKMTDEVWKRDKKAEKPDYIVYNIHPGKY